MVKLIAIHELYFDSQEWAITKNMLSLACIPGLSPREKKTFFFPFWQSLKIYRNSVLHEKYSIHSLGKSG